VLESKKPYERFLDVIDNEKTRHEYVASLRLFMEHYHITEYDELLKVSTEQAEDMIIQYILSMKKKGLSEGLITQRGSAIRKFFSSNRMNLNWDFINQHKGKFKKKQKLEAYTHEQIQKLLEICDHRTRCIVLIFASTGIRIGALPELRKKHLKRIGEFYEFTIYENEEEEYITFCTPECAIAIDNYLAYRERAGETITEQSFLIRKEFDPEDVIQVRNECEPVATSTIRNVISKRMIKAGLRKLEHDVDKTHRKQIPIDHGFRMFFCSQLVNANLNTEKRYLLEGHSLPKNDNSYVRVKEELRDEYLKAIPFLTINEENRLKEKVQVLTKKQDEIEQIKFEHRLEIKKVKDDLSVQMEELKSMMFKNILDSTNYKMEELKSKGITDYNKNITVEVIKKEYEQNIRHMKILGREEERTRKEKDCYPLVGELLDPEQTE
jgi:integrase